jgi:hypothetical protein
MIIKKYQQKNRTNGRNMVTKYLERVRIITDYYENRPESLIPKNIIYIYKFVENLRKLRLSQPQRHPNQEIKDLESKLSFLVSKSRGTR